MVRPSEGEIGALVGFGGQYDLAARIVLAKLPILEWIRVGDPDAGVADDFQFSAGGTHHALQVKWSLFVASIDAEPDLVDLAAVLLAGLGYQPTVMVGDGVAAMPGTAPYDRIIATRSVSAIPPAWPERLGRDGQLVADDRRRCGRAPRRED